LLRLFIDVSPLESGTRTVKVGLQTSDDFRFLRLWWEIPPAAFLDARGSDFWQGEYQSYQDYCSALTREKKWSPLAKGGEYSPYFADVHLVVNWHHDGAEMKAWADPLYDNSGWSRIIKNTGYYFRPGLTWPERTTSGYGPQALPAGVVISVTGQGLYLPSFDELKALLAIHATRVYQYLEEVLIGLGEESVSGSAARHYTSGSIGRLPYPSDFLQREKGWLADAAARIHGHRALEATRLETSLSFDPSVRTQSGIAQNTELQVREEASAAVEALKLSGEVERRLREGLEIGNAEVNEIISVTGPHPALDLPAAKNAEELKEDLLAALGKPIDVLIDEAVGAGLAGRSITKKSYFVSRFHELLAQRWGCSAIDVVEAHKSLGKAPRAVEESAARELVSYLVGAAFGRWDVRLVLRPELRPAAGDPFAPLPPCPPAMLVGPDGLPATRDRIASEAWLAARPDATRLPTEVPTPSSVTAAEYPLEVAWDGLLVDDPGIDGAPPAPWDIEQRARAALQLLWGPLAPSVEEEICQLLGVATLRDYLRSPSGFFADHLSLFSRSRRKAPIYWPLSTASGEYTVWVYYPRLSDDLLHRVIADHISPKSAEVEQRLARLEAEPSRGGKARLITQLKGLVVELREMREEIQRITALPYRPSLDDGVLISAAPLWRLFRLPKWRSELEATWKELESGDYDWAHLAYAIWPARVEQACKHDLSLAIAHGRKDLYVPPPPKAKRGGRRSKGKSA
jgi:hypothetical protein